MRLLRSNRTMTNNKIKNEVTFSGWLMALLLLGGSLNVQAGENSKFVPGVTRPGANIYHNYCSVCHGDKGDGQTRARSGLNPPPRNYTTPNAATELTRERMIHSVTKGRPGTAMIAWETELSPKEIEGVVDYIRTKFMRSEKIAKRPDSKLMASRGGVLYMQACAMCHGDTGKRATSGRMQPPPTDFTAPDAANLLDRKRMIASIANGRPGTAMTGYAGQFSSSDIEAMVDFIRKAFMQLADEPSSPASRSTSPSKSEIKPVKNELASAVISDMSLPMPLGLQGDPDKSGEFFMNTCATCHGINGDGKGPRAFFISPPPRNFLLEASRQRLNRPVLFQAISEGRPGTNMPAWNKVLSNQEIANVAEYVFQNFINIQSGNKGQATGIK